MAWTTVFKSKNAGGQGLQDPEITNRENWAKLWWRWLKGWETPWAKLWKAKYAPNCQIKYLVRLMNSIHGTVIWIMAWNNREIIQHHNFWEIRNGKDALFWEDA